MPPSHPSFTPCMLRFWCALLQSWVSNMGFEFDGEDQGGPGGSASSVSFHDEIDDVLSQEVIAGRTRSAPSRIKKAGSVNWAAMEDKSADFWRALVWEFVGGDDTKVRSPCPATKLVCRTLNAVFRAAPHPQPVCSLPRHLVLTQVVFWQPYTYGTGNSRSSASGLRRSWTRSRAGCDCARAQLRTSRNTAAGLSSARRSLSRGR